MRTLRTFRAAFLVAVWQTVAAVVLAIACAVLLFERGSDTSSSLHNLPSAQELRKIEQSSELMRPTKKLKGLYDAIADGLRTPGL